METSDYLRNFRDRWIIIIVVAVSCLLLALGVGRSITPTYAATATMFLKVESTGASLFERSQFSLQRIKSYPDLVRSPELIRAVITELGLTRSQAELSAQLSAINPADTVLLEITAEAESSDGAAAVANAAAAQLELFVDELENQQSNSSDELVSSTVQLNLTLPAQAPLVPESPNVPVIAGLGLLSGLALGMMLAILIERGRPLIRTAADVRRHTGLPLVGQVWRPKAESPKSEARRADPSETSLRESVSNIRAIFQGSFPRVIGLTTVDARAARANTRWGIARVLAESGRNVLLVEADESARSRPLSPEFDGISGLTDLLSGTGAETPSVVATMEGEKYRVLPVGARSQDLTDFDIENNVGRVFESLSDQFDVVIVQVLATSRPLSIESIRPAMSGVFVVASYSRTTASALRREVARISSIGILPIGVILSDVPPRRMRSLVADWRADDFVHTGPAHLEPVAAVPTPPAPRIPRSRAPRNPAEKAEVAVDGKGKTMPSNGRKPTPKSEIAAPAPKQPNQSFRNDDSRVDTGS